MKPVKIRLVHIPATREESMESWIIEKQNWFGLWRIYHRTHYNPYTKQSVQEYFEMLIFGKIDPAPQRVILFEAELPAKNMNLYEAFKNLTQ